VSALAATPTPSIHGPAVSHPGLAAALFLVLLLGTSFALWWQVRREFRRRAEETMRRLDRDED